MKNKINILEQENTVLYIGPPGCGKTWIAKKAAEKWVEETGGECEFVSLHQGYSYEDFIIGIDFNSHKDFVPVSKVFKKICDTAANPNNKGKKYAIILDDIHRVHMESVLGEVLYAIEYRGREVTLNDGKKIMVPPNLKVIATMSTIKSQFKPDYALLRRFKMCRLESDWIELYKEKVIPECVRRKFKYYNEIIDDEITLEYKSFIKDYYVGLGYFITINDEGKIIEDELKLRLKIRHQVIPLLEQYVKDGILTCNVGEINNERKNTYEQYIVVDRSKKLFSELDIHPYEKSSIRANYSIYISNLIRALTDIKLIDDNTFFEKILYNKDIVGVKVKLNNVDKLYPWFVKEDVYKDVYDKQEKKKKSNAALPEKSRQMFYVQRGNVNYLCLININKTGTDVFNKYITTNSATAHTVLAKIIIGFYLEYLSAIGRYLKDSGKGGDLLENIKKFREIDEKRNSAKNSREIDEKRDSVKKNIDRIIIIKKQENCELIDEFYVGWSDLIEFKNSYEKLKRTTDDGGIFSGLVEYVGVGMEPHCVNFEEGKMKLLHSEKLKGVHRIMGQDYKKIMDYVGVHQMILQGPPGTSKTYGAEQFILKQIKTANSDRCKDKDDKEILKDHQFEFAGTNNKNVVWDIVQFHPSYGYEDFVRGIEVDSSDGKDMDILELDDEGKKFRKKYLMKTSDKRQITYTTKNKILGNMIEDARKNDGTVYYLVIDEINRANMATVFGELIYALEYRGEAVSSPYTIGVNNKIVIPDNFYIIGTMNTADKSISGLDYAIRRRFLFFSLLPEKNKIKKSIYMFENGKCDEDESGFENMYEDELEVKLFEVVEWIFNNEYLNKEYYKDDVQIGHTYFLRRVKEKYEEDIKYRFQYQVYPVLREYYKDGVLVAERFGKLLKDAEDDIRKKTKNKEKIELKDMAELLMMYVVDGKCGDDRWEMLKNALEKKGDGNN